MADDVEQRVTSNVDNVPDTLPSSEENEQIQHQDKLADNLEDMEAFSDKLITAEDSFCEEKSSRFESGFEDEKMTDVANDSDIRDGNVSSQLLNNDSNDSQLLNNDSKDKACDVRITDGAGTEIENACDSDLSSAVQELNDVSGSSARVVQPIPDIELEKTEFRHLHLTEKREKVEDTLSGQTNDNFDSFDDNREFDNVFEDETADNVLPSKPTINQSQSKSKKLSIFKYFMAEISHGYVLELDEDKYDDKRRIVYTFMKIPREVEKLMIFGFMLCLDCFLFMFTFLPVRVLFALWKLLSGFFCCKKTRLLEPTQICDLLKAAIIVVCCCLLEYVDFSVMYHTVRGQSVIKLYVIYNMLEVADRLFSSFGQDILDALFWTATEPRDRKRQHVGTLPHFALGVLYVFLHAVLVLFQATCLNVAVNSHNKALLVILVSNQFVELKGSVFKRFERNNLFQMACSDIRERFHYLVLVSIVCLRNLTEFNWNLEHLHVISPYLFATVLSEYFVDWVKHAFITKFNDIQPEVYREYRSRLAKDATSSRQKNAHADHFDLVSRRMGFIPLPLGSLVIRVMRHSIHISGIGAVVLLIATYIFLMSVKILNSIIFLGKASQYAQEYPTTDNKPKQQHDSQTTTIKNTIQQRLGQSSAIPENVPGQSKKEERKPTKSLAEIDRYTLCSKEIVLF